MPQIAQSWEHTQTRYFTSNCLSIASRHNVTKALQTTACTRQKRQIDTVQCDKGFANGGMQEANKIPKPLHNSHNQQVSSPACIMGRLLPVPVTLWPYPLPVPLPVPLWPYPLPVPLPTPEPVPLPEFVPCPVPELPYPPTPERLHDAIHACFINIT